MGQIFEAYATLNKTLNLGLSMEDLMRAEGTYKSLLAQRGNFPKELALNQEQMTEKFEVRAQLVQRRRALNKKTLANLGARATTQINKEFTALQNNMRGMKLRQVAPRRGFKLTPQMQQKQQQQRLR